MDSSSPVAPPSPPNTSRVGRHATWTSSPALDTPRCPLHVTPSNSRPQATAGRSAASATTLHSAGLSYPARKPFSSILPLTPHHSCRRRRASPGPTFGLEELAGRKLLALFDRAEARDFADVYILVQRYGTATLLSRAAQVDPGLNPTILADMIGSLARFDDADIPIDAESVANLRDFFARWQCELRSGDHD